MASLPLVARGFVDITKDASVFVLRRKDVLNSPRRPKRSTHRKAKRSRKWRGVISAHAKARVCDEVRDRRAPRARRQRGPRTHPRRNHATRACRIRQRRSLLLRFLQQWPHRQRMQCAAGDHSKRTTPPCNCRPKALWLLRSAAPCLGRTKGRRHRRARVSLQKTLQR